MNTPEDEVLRVVLIEDDEAIADMYRLKLEHDGYAVSIAGDGEAGVELVRELLPDLVFLDIRLPRMDGFAVLEQLDGEAQTRDIPVVILSNFSAAELISRGLTLGALDYLIKSETTPSSLSARVPGWAGRAQATA